MIHSVLHALNNEQIKRIVSTNIGSMFVLGKEIKSITYEELRVVASCLFSDGKFVYESDIKKLVQIFEDYIMTHNL